MRWSLAFRTRSRTRCGRRSAGAGVRSSTPSRTRSLSGYTCSPGGRPTTAFPRGGAVAVNPWSTRSWVGSSPPSASSRARRSTGRMPRAPRIFRRRSRRGEGSRSASARSTDATSRSRNRTSTRATSSAGSRVTRCTSRAPSTSTGCSSTHSPGGPAARVTPAFSRTAGSPGFAGASVSLPMAQC